MRKLIALGMMLMSTSALAQNFDGYFICEPSAKSTAGIMKAANLTGSENIGAGIFGPTIVIDMQQASENPTFITTATGNDFNGEVEVGLSFRSRGLFGETRIESITFLLTHKGRSWVGTNETYAKTRVRAPLTEDGHYRIELYSGKGDLILFELECGLSQSK